MPDISKPSYLETTNTDVNDAGQINTGHNYFVLEKTNVQSDKNGGLLGSATPFAEPNTGFYNEIKTTEEDYATILEESSDHYNTTKESVNVNKPININHYDVSSNHETNYDHINSSRKHEDTTFENDYDKTGKVLTPGKQTEQITDPYNHMDFSQVGKLQ